MNPSATRRVLVTNDDGIDGAGLRVLTAQLVASGYEPIVIAPNRDYSGAGGSLLSLGAADPSHDQAELRYERRTLDEAPDVEAIALDGPPALCVLIAMREAFGPRPELVVSGINYGLNVGPAVMHSGTVSAALTAAPYGIPALAVSAEHDLDHSEVRYDTAAAVAVRVLAAMTDEAQVISLNVPKRDLHEIVGVRSAPLSDTLRWRSFVESTDDGVIKRTYAETDDPIDPETDSGLVIDGYAAISALARVTSVDCSELARRVTEASA